MRFHKNPYIGPDGEVLIDDSFPTAGRLVRTAIKILKECFTMDQESVSVHGGLYAGAIGAAWASLRVKHLLGEKNCITLSEIRTYIEKIVNEAAQNGPRDDEERMSFLQGRPGIWLTSAYFYQLAEEIPERDHFLGLYAQLAPDFASPQPGSNKVIFPQGSDELFIGRAGYLCGLHELRKITSETVVPDEMVFAICDAIIDSGTTYAKQHRSQCPLMFAYHRVEYLGAAHGLAGILFALLLFPEYFKSREQAASLVRAAVDYLIAVTPSETGNLPAATDVPPARSQHPLSELVQWCHGAAGAVYVYARAYLLWKDEKYLNEVIKCADVTWHKGLLKKGPGLCHGMSGSGYTQLVAFRLTGQQVYADRAQGCAAFLVSKPFAPTRDIDNFFSLFEGEAGFAVFLADLVHPERAVFPFMNFFQDE